MEEALHDYHVLPGEECEKMRKFLREVNLSQGEAQRIVSIAWKIIQVVYVFFMRDESRTLLTNHHADLQSFPNDAHHKKDKK